MHVKKKVLRMNGENEMKRKEGWKGNDFAWRMKIYMKDVKSKELVNQDILEELVLH